MRKVMGNKKKVIDLTEESDEEEYSPGDKTHTPEKKEVEGDVSDEEDESEFEVKQERSKSRPEQGEPSGIKHSTFKRFRNFDRSLDKAVAKIKKGGSLIITALQYGIPEDVLYKKLVSRRLPKEMEILTPNEENNFVKWILRSNENNCLVFKNQLMERVGKMKKVTNITPIFAKSKFGKMWFDYFMRSHPQIYENDGLLMPSLNFSEDDESSNQWPDEEDIKLAQEIFKTEPITIKEDPMELLLSFGIKDAVVVLHDFRKESNSSFNFNGKEKIPSYFDDESDHLTTNDNNETCVDKDFFEPKLENAEVESDKSSHGDTESCVNIEFIQPKLENAEVEGDNITHDYTKSGVNIEFIQTKLESSEVESDNCTHSNIDISVSEEDIFQTKLEYSKVESDNCTHGKIENSDCKDILLQQLKCTEIESNNCDSESITKEISNQINSNSDEKTVGLKPTCDKCKQTFSSKEKLKRHLYRHIPKELYTITCLKCSRKFPSKYHLNLHLKITHSKTYYKCNDCFKVFKHETSLRKHEKHIHLKIKTPIPCFICYHCKKSFKYKNSLEAHILYRHLKAEKKFSCDICQKKFIKFSLMARHKTRHMKTKPLSCLHCKKTYSRKYLLREHIEYCHQNESMKLRKECEQISKEYLESIDLG